MPVPPPPPNTPRNAARPAATVASRDAVARPAPAAGVPTSRSSGQATGGRSDGSFVSHARTVAGLTLLSRVAGVARDAVCARVFGVGPLWSAFAFAFVIPNLFRRLFSEGALAAAFLPEYTRLMRRDPRTARAFAWLVVATLGIGLSLITVVSEAALWLINRHATASGIEARGIAIELTMLMLPYMPLVCLTAVIGAMLQVHHRFGPTAAAPILLNLCIIAAAIVTALAASPINDPLLNGAKLAIDWFARLAPRQVIDAASAQVGVPESIADPVRRPGIYLVATAVLIAGFLQLVWSLAALRRTPAWPGSERDDGTTERRTGSNEGGTLKPSESPATRLRAMLLAMGPMLLGTGVLQINALIDTIIASYPVTVGDRIAGIAYPLDQAANAVLFYAQRLYQFPLGVFGIAIATAIFPAFARTADAPHAFAETLRRGLRLTMFIGVPASLGLMVVAQPLPAALLRGGMFESADVARVASVLFGYAPAIWAYSMVHVLARAFYALGDARTPVRIAIGMVALNILLNCGLIWWLAEAGLAWSTATSGTANVALLLLFLRRHVPRAVDRRVLRSWQHTAVAATIMLAILLVTDRVTRVWLAAGSAHEAAWWPDAVRLSLLVLAGGSSYLAVARLLAMEEIRWLMSPDE